MKEGTNESKLTPAAREALEEFVQNYKDQLLRSASRSAGNLTGEVREISVRDIFEAISTTQSKALDARTRKRAWLWLALTLVGVTYSITGIALFGSESSTSIIKEPFFQIIIFGLTITLLGSILSFAHLRRRPSGLLEWPFKGTDEQQTKELSFMFLEKWRAIELEARNLVSQKLGESRAMMPLSHLLDELGMRGVLSEDDHLTVRRLLNKRNEILHQEPDLPRSELVSLIKKADELLDRIRSATQ
jgi:hypothetical protein